MAGLIEIATLITVVVDFISTVILAMLTGRCKLSCFGCFNCEHKDKHASPSDEENPPPTPSGINNGDSLNHPQHSASFTPVFLTTSPPPHPRTPSPSPKVVYVMPIADDGDSGESKGSRRSTK